jgi:hypothetical protein
MTDKEMNDLADSEIERMEKAGYPFGSEHPSKERWKKNMLLGFAMASDMSFTDEHIRDQCTVATNTILAKYARLN